MKRFVLSVLLIALLGACGLIYRNAVEHPSKPIVCPMDALVCPDGSAVSRTGTSCTFPECPPPNVSLADISIAFAVPTGFSPTAVPDENSVAAYTMESGGTTATSSADIRIHRYGIIASSTALATIQGVAVNAASGLPVSATSFTSTVIGGHRFTVVLIERFEGVVDTAYFLARGTDVLRFDAIDRGVDWTNPNLDTATLPAHQALVKLLVTLQGQ